MIVKTPLIALAALACAFAGGCGGDATRDVAQAEPPPAKVNVERFLMQDGEEPGFETSDGALTDYGAKALAGGFSPDEVQRLRRAGLISLTFQPLSGPRSAGVTSVLLFKTAAGARDWLEFETSNKGIDSAVPGANPRVSRSRAFRARAAGSAGTGTAIASATSSGRRAAARCCSVTRARVTSSSRSRSARRPYIGALRASARNRRDRWRDPDSNRPDDVPGVGRDAERLRWTFPDNSRTRLSRIRGNGWPRSSGNCEPITRCLDRRC